jgi:epoxyqueuosine reductase
MKQQLRKIAIDAGCAGFGVTQAIGFSGVAETLRARETSGFSGRRRFTYKDPERAADVRISFPWAQAIVALSWPYLPEAGSPGHGEPGTGRIARFATADHYEGLRHAAGMVAAALNEAGHRTEVLVDDDRMVDRAAAVRSGIVWWGKSTMALDPKHGPWLLLGSIVTDATLEPDAPMRRDCGSCDACMPACPTGAIVAPGVLDASRCLAHWMQTARVFPEELRTLLGDRVYGCDDCLDACPPGHKQIGNSSVPVRGRVDLLELLATDDETLLSRFDHFYLPGRRPRILRRNAILALGNTWHDRGDEPQAAKAVAMLGRFLGDHEHLLRLHAAWALGRIGGEAARRHLASRRDLEPLREVLIEIDRALGEVTGSTLDPGASRADDNR